MSKVLIVINEDDGEPGWISDDPTLEVAAVWSYMTLEDIPNGFEALARQYGFDSGGDDDPS